MRVIFHGPLDVIATNESEGGRRKWLLDEPMIVEVLWDQAGATLLTVPAGFVSDFGSVPRAPFAYWLFGDTAHRSAVLHDYLYSRKLYDRLTCDRIFLAAMVEEGIPAWRRQAMYWAVRMRGSGAYNNQEQEGNTDD